MDRRHEHIQARELAPRREALRRARPRARVRAPVRGELEERVQLHAHVRVQQDAERLVVRARRDAVVRLVEAAHEDRLEADAVVVRRRRRALGHDAVRARPRGGLHRGVGGHDGEVPPLRVFGDVVEDLETFDELSGVVREEPTGWGGLGQLRTGCKTTPE